MNHLLRIIGFTVCLVASSTAMSAERDKKSNELQVIPLKEIWAHNMPGTRAVHELEPSNSNQRSSLANQIGGSLDFTPKGQVVGKGIAVLGVDKKALSNAHAVLVKGNKPRQTFSDGDDISLVFFSHLFSQYVHLHSVERSDKVIKISYRIVPHETKQMTAHFALIPLGKLPAGKYRVEIARLPLEEKYVSQGFKPVESRWEKRVVCQPFSFTVK